jgi:TonB family protein
MLSQPIPARMPAQEVPLGLFPTYCFDPGTDSLRLSYDFGSQDIVRNAIGHFANRSVASSITINDGGLKLATGQILLLRTEPAPEPEIESTEGLVPLSNGRARVAGGVIAGSILNKVTPRYPESAKERHVSGMVTMKAIIGRDGHIRNLRVIKCPDTDLAIAALAAVRHWTYKPYLLNGQPTEVDTTITVNFAFGPG